MKPWELAIKKPVSVFMGLVCVLVLGLISMKQLKLAFLPKVDFPAMAVEVSYPNQSPDLMEREVTRPLEEALSTLKGVRRISSESSADSASVRLEFAWGMELDLIRLEMGLKVEEAKHLLPEGVQHVSIFSFNTSDIPVIESRISAPGLDLSENYDLLEKHIKQKLERVPGVARVELGGVLPKEVSIDLKLDAINAYRVDVETIIDRLSKDNVSLSAGNLKANGLVYNIRSMGKIRSLEEFGEIMINDEGLRLKDVADVVYEEPPIGLRRHLNGDKALALTIFKESTANTVEVADAVNAKIDGEISNDPVLKGISVYVWDDQAKEITNGIDGLTQAGFYGALFAVLVLLFFLRSITATLIVATAIPISIIGSFIFLYAFGYTLNVLTMMGLMLAVGMLVDNAVVVLESIFTRKLEGLSAKEATSQGTREVMVALVAATSSTMIVFLSLVISEGNELAVWLGALGVTITLTLLTSLIVSTTVIPLFASRLLSRVKPRKEELRLVKWYSALLDWSLKHRVITFLALLGLVISAVFPVSQLDQFKGGSSKNNRMVINYEFHDFFFASEVEDAAYQVEAWLETKREEWGLRSIYSWMQENNGGTVILFEDENTTYAKYKEVRQAIRDQLTPPAGISFLIGRDDDEEGQAVRLQLFGAESRILKEVGSDIAASLGNVVGLEDIRSGERSGKKELVVSVDREQANLYGISPNTIAQVFGFTLRGMYLPRFAYGDRERDVLLGLRIEDRATIEDVSKIRIGGDVSLGSVAKFEFRDRPESIRRVNRKAHHVVRATYEGEQYDQMQQQIETLMADYSFPAGVTWSWSDNIMREEDEMANMLNNLLLAIVLVYLVMASLFESLTQPIMILFSTLLFSATGAFWTLYFTKTEMDVMAMIGMMILIGIVVNNGIILMDRFNHLLREGYSVEEAARKGAHDRIRPILMTAATTIMGLIPMAFGNSGVGGGYYFPLARCVIGGLTSSTALTLIGLPFILITVYKMKMKILGWLKKLMPKGAANTPVEASPQPNQDTA